MIKNHKGAKQGQYIRDSGCIVTRAESDENDRKFNLSFSSEEPYDRWFGAEILDHAEGCVDLSRLSTIGCVLYNHNRDSVIGKVSRVWVENNRGYADIELDDDDESNKVFKKMVSGSLKGVSVGYQVDEWDELDLNKHSADGRFVGPVSVARKWTPFEISIVSVPADPTVGVGRDMTDTSDTRTEPSEEREIEWYEWQLKINKNKLLAGGNNR